MADPFASFLARARGQAQPDDDEGLTGIGSIDDLRGTVFDDSDPIAQWKRLSGPAPREKGLVERGVDFLMQPIAPVAAGAKYLGERALDWAQTEENPALRALKAYPGAVAETVGEMASPVGIASFATGPLGVGARSTLSGAALGSGVPELTRGIREGDTRAMMGGAGMTALGALGVAGDVAAIGARGGAGRFTPEAGWTAPGEGYTAASRARPVRPRVGLPESAAVSPSETDALSEFLLQERTPGRLEAGADQAASTRGRKLLPPAGDDPVASLEAELYPDFQDFTFEGEANERPGEFPPGPTIGKLTFGRPYPEQPPLFTFEGQANERPGDYPPGPSVGELETSTEPFRQLEQRRAAVQSTPGSEPVGAPRDTGPSADAAADLGDEEFLDVLAELERQVRGEGAGRSDALPEAARSGDVARLESPGGDRQLVEPDARGLEPSGGGELRARGRRAARASSGEQSLVEDLVAKAVEDGYQGDTQQLRAMLDDRVQMVKEIDYDYANSGRSPENLLRAIADAGGLSVGAETAQKGELRWLQEFQDNFGTSQQPRYAFGNVNGIRGVFNERGLSLDGMLEALQQDARFNHIESINDLVDELRGASTAEKGSLERLLERAGVEYGGDWWKERAPETDFNPEAIDQDEFRRLANTPTSGNMWWNIGEAGIVPSEYSLDELERLSSPERGPVADTLPTGELQPRLPEAGRVRDVDVTTPEFEAPFSLTAPKNEGVDALERSLFDQVRETPATGAVDEAPSATFRGWQEDADGGFFPQYDVRGGEFNRSTVGVERLRELGIDIPDTPAPPGSEAPAVQTPVPSNVRDFLVKQLGYSPEDVTAMGAEEATRIGRAREVNPNRQGPAPAAPVTPLEERAGLPRMETFDETRRARGLQRRQRLERRGVEPFHVEPQEGAPAPRTAAERQAAGEQLTTRERESLGMPAETRERGRVSLREQGSSPRQIARRAQKLDAWMDNPTPENFARWVNEVSAQAERVNAKQLKGGTGESAAPPRTPSGEVLAGSPFPGFQVLADPKLLRTLASFIVSNEPVDRLLRGAIGGAVGASTNDDNRLKGALYGAVAGVVGPEVARAVANDFVLLAKGQVPKGLAQVYNPRRGGDIGHIENIFGTKARTIPEQFRAVRGGVEELARVRESGKIDSRFPLTGRLDEGGPAFKEGKMQIRQSTFLKPEIKYLRDESSRARAAGKPRLASYLSAYAEELAGSMTRSEQFFADQGIPIKGTARTATEVSNQVYRTGLAFNAGSAFVNRLSQPLLTAPYVGLRNLWKNYAPLSAAEKGLSEIKRPIDIDEVPRAALSVLQKFDDVASSLMRFTDNQNRQGAYAAAHLAAERAGASPKEAYQFARDVSEKTQGLLGLLAGNPRWRGPIIKTIKPFTKYPILFAEWLNDVATSPDPRVRWRTAAMAAGAWAFSQATGIDVWDLLSGGARYGGSALLRGAMDVYAHATNQVRDHTLIAAPGKGFKDSDVGAIAYPTGIRKGVDTATRFARQGLGTHHTRTQSGAREELTPVEDLMNFLGVRSTRQTARQHMLDEAHASELRAQNEDAQAGAQAKRDFYAAVDAGDADAMREALLRMSPATRRNVVKTQNRDRFERLLHTTPRKRRHELTDRYAELERELSVR